VGLPDDLEDLLAAWCESPSTHPRLGDWRRVGYGRGSRRPAATGEVVLASRVGIPPDAPHDTSERLQAELDALGAAGGGVLQLEAGRYTLDRPLFVHHSRVVLRGAGTHATTLFFPRPLAESVHDNTAWSWTGGQVFFVARERLAASMGNGWAYGWSGDEGWLAGEALGTVASAPRGTDVLQLDDTSALEPAMVLLEITDRPGADHRMLREMGGDVEGARTYPWDTTVLAGAVWTWPVVITEVLDAQHVQLEQPLRVTIHPETTARLRALGPTVHDSGVEGLTIENALRVQTTHNENPGSNGVCFQAVHDCWAIDVHVVNADVAFSMTSAKSCTLARISAGGRSLHHFTITRAHSHDNLVEDFVLEDFTVPAVPGSWLHGINVEVLSSGNVWRRGTMHTGTFDSHRGLPFENLRTNITLVNKDAVPGGAFDAGPLFGARTVHWGIDVLSGETMCIDVTDVAPKSLTAGITGLAEPGSRLRAVPSNAYFVGALESERLAFGVDLGRARDLLDLQRSIAPIDAIEQ
jgi:hypothetical protein